MNLLSVFSDLGSSQFFCTEVSRRLEIKKTSLQNNVTNVELCSTYEYHILIISS